MTWGLVAVGGATVVAGGLNYLAADKAGEVQAEASRAGIAETARQFDITQEQLAPFREAGVSALAEQQALLGLGTPEEAEAAMARFTETPGQQFLRSQQERALTRNAAAIGGLGGGNVRRALQESAFGRAQTDLSNRLNRLAGISGTGQTATTATGQFGAGASRDIANLQTSAGAARASGILGQQQAIAGTVQNLTGLATQGGIFSPKTPAAPAAPVGMAVAPPFRGGRIESPPTSLPQFPAFQPPAFQRVA